MIAPLSEARDKKRRDGREKMLAQQIMSGLATGSLYALTAIAVVVVFRNTRTINLAQGDFAMIGAFLGVVFLKELGLNYYATVELVVAVVTGLVIGTAHWVALRVWIGLAEPGTD